MPTRVGSTTEFDLAAERWAWVFTVLVSLPVGYAAWLLAEPQPLVAFMLGFVVVALNVMQGARWYCLPDRHGVRPNREYVR